MKNLRPVRNIKRLGDVQAVLLRHGFDFILDNREVRNVRGTIQKRLRFYQNKGKNQDQIPDAIHTSPEHARLTLEELGPTYVKLGQVLSSRSDLLSAAWIAELSKLQDNVPPFDFDLVKQIILEDFGQPVESLFAKFNPNPVAAASIGQVHRAILKDGSPVAVKIQRPAIQTQVNADLDIIREVAGILESRMNWGKRLGLKSLVEEFAQTLQDEMDYSNEAHNADRLRRNLQDEQGVYVPLIYWDLVSTRVLTMEAIEGIKIDDLQALTSAGVNLISLASTFIHCIFHQLLIDGFFHADPHPGNLFIRKTDQILSFIDLGMMGTLLPEQITVLGDIVQAVLRRDSLEIVRQMLEIGSPFEEINEHNLRRSIDRIIHRYLDAPLEKISFAKLIQEILQVIFQNGIRLPGELSLACKTIIQAEAVARMLNPQVQVIEIVEDTTRQILAQRLKIHSILDLLFTGARDSWRIARILPRAGEILLKQIEHGSIKVGLDMPDLRQPLNLFLTISNRLTAGLIIAGMIIGSAIVMGVSPDKSWSVIPIIGIIGFMIAMTIGGMLIWSIFIDIWRAGRRKNKP